MVILEPLSLSLGNVSNLRAWAVLVQSDGSNSTLSHVVHGDIALSTPIIIIIINTFSISSFEVFLVTKWL